MTRFPAQGEPRGLRSAMLPGPILGPSARGQARVPSRAGRSQAPWSPTLCAPLRRRAAAPQSGAAPLEMPCRRCS